MSLLMKISRLGNRNINSYRNVLSSFVRQEHKLESPTHRVNALEKKFLVWTGKYKRVEDVPDHVNQNVVERARNRMRIRISNYMMAFTAVGCVIMVIIGKKAAGRGESISKQSADWHKQQSQEAQGK